MIEFTICSKIYGFEVWFYFGTSKQMVLSGERGRLFKEENSQRQKERDLYEDPYSLL